MVTGEGIASGIAGQAPAATDNTIEAGADVTANSVPRLELAATSVTIAVDHTGTVQSGQLPRVVGVRRMRGDTNVSASTTWSIPSASGVTATIDDTATASGGNITVTACNGSGYITVRGVRDSVTLKAPSQSRAPRQRRPQQAAAAAGPVHRIPFLILSPARRQLRYRT